MFNVQRQEDNHLQVYIGDKVQIFEECQVYILDLQRHTYKNVSFMMTRNPLKAGF